MNIYVDGWLKDTNPSNKGGWTVKSQKFFDTKQFFGENITNNQVELMAIINGLIVAKKKDVVISDSQFSVNSILVWKKISKKNVLGGLVLLARELVKIKKVNLIWQRRDTNLAGQYNDDNYKQAGSIY